MVVGGRIWVLGPRKCLFCEAKRKPLYQQGSSEGLRSLCRRGGSWDMQDLRNKVTTGNKVGRLVYVVIIATYFN